MKTKEFRGKRQQYASPQVTLLETMTEGLLCSSANAEDDSTIDDFTEINNSIFG